MKQIFIENFRVDISRCEVHREEDIVSLEPKVLQVLLYLVKHQGEVVSYQALLDEVWPNSVVEANALQRCIGQLRKAFRDDAKQQRVISTYPKNGYSLKVATSNEIPQTANASKTASSKLFLAFGLLIFISIAFFALYTRQPLQEAVPGIINGFQSSLKNRSTDFYALYSPDGQYVAYPRPVDNTGKLKSLWIQNLSTNIETLLTPEPGLYDFAAWSPDSQYLSFVESEAECSALKLASLAPAETYPTQITTLLDCRVTHLQSPQWISNNNIVLIETDDNASTIINYDLTLAHTETIFQEEGILPQHLAYSADIDRLAITIINSDFQQQLHLLSIASEKLSSLALTLPKITMNEPWYPVWNRENNGLIISSSEGIFNIGLDGSVSRQGSPLKIK